MNNDTELAGGQRSGPASGTTVNGPKENDFNLSRVEPPHGRDAVFRQNVLHMSSLAGLYLNRSEFSQNTINMSHLAEMSLIESALSRLTVNASSLIGFELEKSQFTDSEVGSAKVSRLLLSERSRAEHLKWTASTLRGLSLLGCSQWLSSVVKASEIVGFGLRSSRLEGVEIDAAQLAEVHFASSEAKDVLIRFLHLNQVFFSKTRLENVLFSYSGEGLNDHGLDRVRFENVKLHNVLIGDCRWRKVTIRNVDLSNLKIVVSEVKDREIDGNDEFLKTFGFAKR